MDKPDTFATATAVHSGALANCPFCGGGASLCSGGAGNHYVKCGHCFACGDDGTKERAIVGWNRRALSAPEAAHPGAAVAWRCFHCDEIFTDRLCAADHFGCDETSEPACKIKMGAERSMLTALRRAERDAADAWFKIHNEATDSAKAFYAQAARHQEQLRAAEELGFERGYAAQVEINQISDTSTPRPAAPTDGDIGALVELVNSRIGQDFDGECHLTEAEASRLTTSLVAMSAKLAEVEQKAKERLDRCWRLSYRAETAEATEADLRRQVDAMSDGGALAEIAAERQRQVTSEGWTLERDDQYVNGELARAAGIYAVIAGSDRTDYRNAIGGYSLNDILRGLVEHYWPWARSWFKPTTRHRDLVKAGALIVGEIERLGRASGGPDA